jgi:predicted phage-related endonuclease
MTALSADRAGKVTASRLPGILGLSPYNSRSDVLREMVRETLGAPREFVGNIATDYGHEHEADAIAEYERMRGVLVLGEQQFFSTSFGPEDYEIGATVDGLVGDDRVVEAKAPYKATYSQIDERPDYEAQIRLQLECTGRKYGDFVVWRTSGISVSTVEYDPLWFSQVAEGPISEFLREYWEIIDDIDLAKDFLAPKVDERTDPEWQISALEYVEAKAMRDHYQTVMDSAGEALKALSDGKASKGFGVQVIPSERKGAIDTKLAEQAGLALERFRKPPIDILTVRAAGK